MVSPNADLSRDKLTTAIIAPLQGSEVCERGAAGGGRGEECCRSCRAQCSAGHGGCVARFGSFRWWSTYQLWGSARSARTTGASESGSSSLLFAMATNRLTRPPISSDIRMIVSAPKQDGGDGDSIEPVHARAATARSAHQGSRTRARQCRCGAAGRPSLGTSHSSHSAAARSHYVPCTPAPQKFSQWLHAHAPQTCRR